MKRRNLLKGIGATGVAAVSGGVAAAGTETDDYHYFVQQTESGQEVTVVSGSFETTDHEDGDCAVRCCGDCPCPIKGCHCGGFC